LDFLHRFANHHFGATQMKVDQFLSQYPSRFPSVSHDQYVCTLPRAVGRRILILVDWRRWLFCWPQQPQKRLTLWD
jgi:hypothetical protein